MEFDGIVAMVYNLVGLRHLRANNGLKIGQTVFAIIHIIFACLKIHGIRVKKNKLLEAYIGFRYVHFILIGTGIAILGFLTGELAGSMALIAIVVGFFILDIGLTVILHSIRVSRENTETTVNSVSD